MRVVRLATGVLLFTPAAALLYVGVVFAFTPGGTDISEINNTVRFIGFVLLVVGAALGWIGWRLVRRRRPVAPDQ